MGWEAEFLKKTKGSMTVPFHIDNLTAKTLTAELRANGTIGKKTTVKSFTYKVIDIGEEKTPENGRIGVLSCIFRLHIIYVGGRNKGPPSAIFKVCPMTPDFYVLRGICGTGCRAWEIECKYYNRNNSVSTMPAPMGYFAVYDPEA